VQTVLSNNPSLLSEKNENGLYAIHLAAQSGNADIVTIIINTLSTINAARWIDTLRTPDGETALYLAVLNGFRDIEQILVKSSASVNLPNIDGRTPLEVAALKKHFDPNTMDIIRDLMKAGGNVDLIGNSEAKDYINEVTAGTN
jgi:uncharacterized protein